MNDVLRWKSTIDSFVDRHSRHYDKDRKDDLRQDIYLALLEETEPITDEEAVVAIATTVVTFQRYRQVYEQKFIDRGYSSNRDLEDQVEAQRALQSLPTSLREIASDLFIHEFSQEEIARKYGRTQPWVSGVKKRILDRLRAHFTERRY